MSFTPGAGTRFLVTSTSSGTPLSGPLSITGGTATANTPVLSATQTWNNAAVTFTGWQLNVTDTASNASSLLMDLQVGGVSRFSITKQGMIQGPNAPFEIRTFSTNPLDIIINTNRISAFNTSDGFRLASGFAVCWSSGTTDVNFPRDLFLFRDAANTLAQRNGVNAQTLRVYNTFTDATNYQRLAVTSATTTLSALSGASVTATSLIPDGAVVVGVTTRVSTEITGATGYQVGTLADPDRWGDITGIAPGTTSDNTNWTAGTIECFTAASDVVITAKTSNFTGGAISVTVHYLIGQAD